MPPSITTNFLTIDFLTSFNHSSEKRHAHPQKISLYFRYSPFLLAQIEANKKASTS